MIPVKFQTIHALALSFAVFFLMNAACVAGETNAAPTTFRTAIGGFLGTAYWIELKGGVLQYSESESGHTNKVITIAVTDEQWRQFRSALDGIKIWSWRSSYINHEVLDGTQWSIDVEFSDHALHSKGDNDYPMASGAPNGQPEPTETFVSYLKAVQALIGGKTFK